MSGARARALGVATAAALAALVPLVGACADEEIVLATIPDATDAGPSGSAKRCTAQTDCGGSTFCARARCDDVAGVCEPLPVVCGEDAVPVCGCDGVTYWNDCLRRTAGITAAERGECRPDRARACNDPPGPPPPGRPRPADACPAGSTCARLLPPGSGTVPEVCPLVPAGVCWALPAVCPTQSGSDRWVECGRLSPPCATTCDAIRSGEAHRRARACP